MSTTEVDFTTADGFVYATGPSVTGYERRACVYFARQPGGRRIKIGKTRQLERRMATLGTEALATVWGLEPRVFGLEASLHRLLADHRESGEWFAPHPQVLALVDLAAADRFYGLD